MSKMSQIIADAGGLWHVKGPPVAEAVLEKFLAECPYRLPAEYSELVRAVNGAEGSLDIRPWWFQLWRVEEVIEMNEGYSMAELHSGYFAFGSSGGGVLFAFNVNSPADQRVFAVPLDSPDHEDVREVAPDLLTFARALGRSDDNGLEEDEA